MSKHAEILKKSAPFQAKNDATKALYAETLKILDLFGLPLDNTGRRLERTVGAFLALCDVNHLEDLSNPKDINSPRSLKTREIIDWENEFLEEDISSGSYDDIRRKDLKLLVLGEIVVRSAPSAATNDSTRGYGINPIYSEIMKSYGDENWETVFALRLQDFPKIKDVLARKRDIKSIPVQINATDSLVFSPGKHNELQKAIIEELLPRYGYGAELLYVGDTSDKYLYVETERLSKIGLANIAHEELPDIIAYSESKNWIYFIEAVHSSGPISEPRRLQLFDFSKNAEADVVMITAFLDVKIFRRFVHDIAWETEVWIADNPDHLIHFNGDKFLGAYKL